VGLKLLYNINNDWTIRAFTGRQKNRFELYQPVIKGASLEGYMALGESAMTPGFGISSRTLDDGTMNTLVSTLNTYNEQNQFIPRYNTYAYSFYNTLYANRITWFLELAYKSKDAMNDPFGKRLDAQGNTVVGNTFIQDNGLVAYTTLAYATKGLGISIELKHTEGFNYRTRPQESLNNGLINYLPSMTRQNNFRLNTLYTAATQELGEQAIQIELRKKITERWKTTAHYSYIQTLTGEKLYNELLWENLITKSNLWRLTIGIQHQFYNQEIYEVKPGVASVRTLTPYLEYLRTFKSNRSMRIESQYMYSQQDRGSWVNLLVELGWAPKWLVTFSNLYNIGKDGDRGAHYYSGSVVYQKEGNRFNIGYFRQVEGIVCAGGICRFEPAFNGVKMSIISNF